ncbi:MAG: efflux RND transporter permease subunit, partial [Treponema sp.]|nr:efflux RND transporter permease subunit [Treponema sp.]
MRKNQRIVWLEKPVASLCLIGTLFILSILIIASHDGTSLASGFGDGIRHLDAVFTVIMRHYGVDALSMERSAAIPLEDALSGISGAKSVLTVIENGKARVLVRFDAMAPGLYEAVRDAAQRVYETLPPSAQRPEILLSDDSRIPVWTAAVFAFEDNAADSRLRSAFLGNLLEKSVKPALEAVEGVGEAVISGTGVTELVVRLKPEITAAMGIRPDYIAGVLAENDRILSGGTIASVNRDVILTFDGRYDERELGAALIPLPQPDGGFARLSDIASIYENEREPDVLSRLDGKRAAVVSIMAETGVDMGTLSRNLEKAVDMLERMPISFKILSDRGKEEREAFRSVLIAAIQGAVAVAFMSALCSGLSGFATMIISALAVPFIAVCSAAILVLLGFPLEKNAFAGLSAGMGAAVDAALLTMEALKRASGTCAAAAAENRLAKARTCLARLVPPLIAGSVTTVAALIPLIKMASASDSDIYATLVLAFAIGTVTLASLATALILLPPLLVTYGSGGNAPRAPVRRSTFFMRRFPIPLLKFRRLVFRALARGIRLSTDKPAAPIAAACAITAAGIIVLIVAGVDVATEEGSANSVYAQVEFEGGFRAEEGDMSLAACTAYIQKQSPAIASVQTSARSGSGSILVTFDNRKITANTARIIVKNCSIPGAFVYLPENSNDERVWRITVSGDEAEICRETARKAADICANLPLVNETILNFKSSGARLTLAPDRKKIAEAGLSFAKAADTVRRAVYGPVAYKRIDSQGETDVRVRLGAAIPAPAVSAGDSSDAATRDVPAKERIQIITLEGNVRLDSLVTQSESPETSAIYREDRRRTASISIRTRPMDPRSVRDEVMTALKVLRLPAGYTISFDRDAIRRAENISASAAYFVLAALFCYMVIAAANESFVMPFAALAVVPPSLAVPALVLIIAGFSFNAGLAASFIAVSGIAVNAAVLILDEIRGHRTARGFYCAIRRKLSTLLSTTGTTIAGVLPFLFLPVAGGGMVKTLAVVSALGVGASCIVSLFLPIVFLKMFEEKRIV